MTPADQPITLTADQVREWLGGPRFGRYLTAAAGDPRLALGLYEWNSHIATAALRDICHFEVAMRNAYDEQLSQVYPGWAGDAGSRLFRLESGPAKDRIAQRELNEGSRNKLAFARRGLGAAPSHGQVLAALDYGFWAQLTKTERTATVWTPMISRAYPGHLSRGQVHELVDRVRKFRNRLAHNEPVFSNKTGLILRLQDMASLFQLLRPAAAQWVQEHSSVPPLIGKCPVPALMPTTGRGWPITSAPPGTPHPAPGPL